MAKMVKLVETKQSGFLLLFLAIILSILANIIWAGQNIDNSHNKVYYYEYDFSIPEEMILLEIAADCPTPN